MVRVDYLERQIREVEGFDVEIDLIEFRGDTKVNEKYLKVPSVTSNEIVSMSLLDQNFKSENRDLRAFLSYKDKYRLNHEKILIFQYSEDKTDADKRHKSAIEFPLSISRGSLSHILLRI